jgi:hypothetical protein
MRVEISVLLVLARIPGMKEKPFPFRKCSVTEHLRRSGMDLKNLGVEDVWLIGLCRRYGQVFNVESLKDEFDIKGLICGFFVALELVSGRTMLLDSAFSPIGERWFYPI